MSNVLDRPRGSAARSARSAMARAEPIASIWVRGAFAATWAVAVGVASLVVLSLVVWAADSSSTASAGGAMRFAVQLWLLGQRTPLRLPDGALTIPPLALTLLFGLLVARATAILARSTTCADARGLGVIVAAVTTPYAILATVLAAATQSSALRPSVGAAFVCAVVVGGLSATIGAARGAGLVRPTWRALTPDARASMESALAAVAVLVLAGMVFVIGSLFAHSANVGTLITGYRGGPGEFSMVLLSVLMLPNAACFAVGYLTGPGFAIGSGTSVAYGHVQLAAMPAFPLLASVPSGRPPWQVMTVGILMVIGAGVAAGWRAARASEINVRQQLRSVLVGGALSGVVIGALVGYSGGPGGPGRLATVGASPWQVGLAVAAEISLVGLITVMISSWSRLARDLLAGR